MTEDLYHVDGFETLRSSVTSLNTKVSEADDIIDKLYQCKINLVENWKGEAAVNWIRKVIDCYKNMVKVRNNLSFIVHASSKAVNHYVNVEIANTSSIEPFSVISYNERNSNIEDVPNSNGNMRVDYAIKDGQRYLNDAVSDLDTFITGVDDLINSIKNTWISGPGRAKAEEVFGAYGTECTEYRDKLKEVKTNLDIAVTNYFPN